MTSAVAWAYTRVMAAMKIAYSITKRGEKSYWNRIGVAFVNRDGSLTVKLEALPINGEIQIRDQKERDGESSRGDSDEQPWG